MEGADEFTELLLAVPWYMSVAAERSLQLCQVDPFRSFGSKLWSQEKERDIARHFNCKRFLDLKVTFINHCYLLPCSVNNLSFFLSYPSPLAPTQWQFVQSEMVIQDGERNKGRERKKERERGCEHKQTSLLWNCVSNLIEALRVQIMTLESFWLEEIL